MMEWIRYRMLMRRLRGEIAVLTIGQRKKASGTTAEAIKSAATACKACGSIV
ncbi:MAG: hypothetical protein II117_03455 [Clostridia bacterium]|nr:hypothetical protein [Clostridia bacterium]